MIILDGVGDRPIKKIGKKTPLEKANTPNLDKIAKNGINGIMDPISPGTRPGSDTAHLSLLGYKPKETYRGRGPFEAAGTGIDIKENDICFRVNYATKKDNKIIDRRANRIKKTKEISKSIKNNIKNIEGTEIIFKDSTAHRAALVLRGEELSDKITRSDPKETNKPPEKMEPLEKDAEKTARILKKFIQRAERVLKNHPANKKRKKQNKLPANTLLLRGAGKTPDVQNFQKKYGLKGTIISATGLIQGIGKIIGLDVVQPKGTTCGYDSNLNNKSKATKKALKNNDFVLLHIKGGDEVSHDGDYKKKIDFLENKVDSAIGNVLESINNRFLTILTADHSTPISIKDHSADPVPLSIMGEGTRTDEVKSFDENTYQGGLCRIKGKNLFPISLDLINKTHKFGA
ncbi:2,3-bisphosphoglycerate-independent phosphoglycerate mutase [archaeon SCG-AAA382B04]|nr:2,3-bisphosphoglycerate-independent phosphoglycerate mutase [archaeon SCG-AAA382B04]